MILSGFSTPPFTAEIPILSQGAQMYILDAPSQVNESERFNFTVRLINATGYDSIRTHAVDSDDVIHTWNPQYFNNSLEIFDMVATMRLHTPGVNYVFVEAYSSIGSPDLEASFTVNVIEVEEPIESISIIYNPFTFVILTSLVVSIIYWIRKRLISHWNDVFQDGV